MLYYVGILYFINFFNFSIFSAQTVEEILENLKKDGSEWALTHLEVIVLIIIV